MKKILFLLVLFIFSVVATASDELRQRRAKIAEIMGNNAVLVMFPKKHSEEKSPYRQEHNFYYLTNDPNMSSHFVLLKNNGKLEERIFTKLKDPQFELVDGKLPTVESLRKATGVKDIFEESRFEKFIHSILLGTTVETRNGLEENDNRYADHPEHTAFYKQVEKGNVEVWLDLGRKRSLNQEESPSAAQIFARKLRDNFPEVKIRNVNSTIQKMREVKSATELAIMQRGVEITAKIHLAAMKEVQTATLEYDVKAKVEEVIRREGECCWAYEPITASGANATILHYRGGADKIKKGDLFLLDAGAETKHYTTDVTRTFPVTGKFSEDQKIFYELVLNAQRSAIAKTRKGENMQSIGKVIDDILADGLFKLGLIAEKTNKQAYSYNVHGLGHSVGLHVHDPFEYHKNFREGVVITVEPGIYVRKKDVLEKPWFKALNQKDRARITKNLDRYDGIGIRIEDQVLVTDGAPRIMSIDIPVTVADIEATMARLSR